MFKKTVILGLVLLFAGTVLLGWVFAGQSKEERLLQEERERLKTKLDKLDEMVGDEVDVRHFGNIAYDASRQQGAAKYKMREEKRGLVLTVGSVFTLTGGTVLSWWLLLGMVRLLVRGAPHLAGFLRSGEEANDEPAGQADTKLVDSPATVEENEKDSDVSQAPRGMFANAQGKTDDCQSSVEEHSEVLTNSGWQNFKRNSANGQEPAFSETEFSTKRERPGEKCEPEADGSALGEEKLGVLLCDEESVELEEPFKGQSEDLQKQMAEFRRMAQSVQQNALEHSKPVNESLRELSQQVSAIREYAACQQERVEKLQDGYDWNIVRNFCLRVIRCVDNLESRIARLAEEDTDTSDLEEVRDELMFALESTGVEQFEPEINSDYRGQERKTEAVKDKEEYEDAKLRGKIAKVIRPGYQYIIDEENVKVVRTAQVKLYG